MKPLAGFRIVIIGVAIFLAIQGPAVATPFTPVALDSIANLRIQDKNSLYPEGFFLTGFGVPFEIATGGNNAWGAGNGIGGAFGNNGPWHASIKVGKKGVKTIYTLANTDWGGVGDQRFSIMAKYGNGIKLVWHYTDGQQLRDWNLFPAFATTINGTDTNEVFSLKPPIPVFDPPTPDVLDMQTLHVPELFHGLTLDELKLVDFRQTLRHSVFVSGITLSDIGPVTRSLKPSSIPEPMSIVLLSSAIMSLIIIARRRKQL